MSLDFYEIKPTKTIHFFDVIEKVTGCAYILRIEESTDLYSEPDIIVIDPVTNKKVTNQIWEEIVEEFETKII